MKLLAFFTISTLLIVAAAWWKGNHYEPFCTERTIINDTGITHMPVCHSPGGGK